MSTLSGLSKDYKVHQVSSNCNRLRATVHASAACQVSKAQAIMLYRLYSVSRMLNALQQAVPQHSVMDARKPCNLKENTCACRAVHAAKQP
jgi:hypothetical protein